MRPFVYLASLSLAVLLGVWVLYPAVVALLARGRRGREAPDVTPAVSIVLATRDSADAIRARVRNALGAAYPPSLLEVVVALDARSTTRPEELAGIDPRVRVVAGDAPGGKAAALNAGARAATGEVLIMADTSSRFESDAVSLLARAAMHPDTGAVSGSLLLPGADSAGRLIHWYWAMETRLREDEGTLHSAPGVTGAIYAMRRALWTPLPAGLILDDVWVPMRLVLAGKRVDFERGAVASDARPPVRGNEFRRKVRTLTGVIQLCAWMPELLLPVRNPIWAQFVVHKLLRLLTPYLLLGIVIGVAGAAVLAFGIRELALAAGLVAAAVALLLVVRAELRHRFREMLLWGVTLQAAVVVATYNGLRGRWDVWHR